MADRSTITYAVKSFDMQLDLVPNMQMLRKSIKDMLVSLPKKVAEGTAATGLMDSYESFAKSLAEKGATFDDVRKHFHVWTEKALAWLGQQNDEELEVKRGRQGELDQELELFGQKALTSQLAGALLKGSPLEGYLTSGLPENFSEWDALTTVTNRIATVVKSLVPDDKRKARKSKEKTEAKTEENKTEDSTETSA